ncbi:MAG TPA: hypothetical protein VFS58_05270 [Steroidobacteraceae bacterium]|nr:hypothetical protein [Steroidobacteraceae bacterium]
MTLQAHPSPLRFLLIAAGTQIVRRPYLSISVVAHAALLALLYYFGSYQPELRRQDAEVASSLRATSLASTTKRLQDLQTIKQLMEKSADRVAAQPEQNPSPSTSPQTPQEMVERARELSQAIDALDEEIKAEELAELIGVPKTPPAAAPAEAAVPEAPVAADGGQADDSSPPITEEMAASEVAALEAKARVTLAQRQQRMEAKENGVQVEGGEQSGAGKQGGGDSAAGPPNKGGGSNSTVRAEIGEFIADGESFEQATGSTKYAGANGDIFAGGNIEIPTVDATSLVLGRGRMLGAGGEYANRVYLNTWYIIGPFPGRHGRDLFDNPSYPPEKAVLLDAVYFGKDKRLLKWRYVTAQSYPLVPPDLVEDSVYYGYTEVFVDEACDLTAWIGVDDDVQIDLNGRRVWEGGNVNKRPYFDAIFNPNTTYLRDYNRTEGKRVLHFKKGRNKIFFKMSNGPNDPFLSMVLTR